MPKDCDRQKFTVLGSGSAVPWIRRASAANLLRKGGHMILIDAGQGCLMRLLETGVDSGGINHICLTHFHPDHSLELVSLVFGRYNGHESRWNAPLHVYGGSGLAVWWRALCAAWPGLQKPYAKGLLVLHELKAGETIMADIWRVTTAAVEHKPESLAYRFEHGGQSLVISGDTGPVNNLADFAQNADLLVLECGAGLKPMPGHLSVAQAAVIATAAQPRNLILTHIDYADDANILRAAFRALYPGRFKMACDLLTVEV